MNFEGPLHHTLAHVGTPAIPDPSCKLREDVVESSSGLGAIAVHFNISVLSLAVSVRLDSGLALSHESSKHSDTDQKENSHSLVISPDPRKQSPLGTKPACNTL